MSSTCLSPASVSQVRSSMLQAAIVSLPTPLRSILSSPNTSYTFFSPSDFALEGARVTLGLPTLESLFSDPRFQLIFAYCLSPARITPEQIYDGMLIPTMNPNVEGLTARVK